MPHASTDAESWKRMVLRSMPPPAWLSDDAPHGDVVLSSRCRVMRNVRGFRFPHHATDEELQEVARQVLHAGRHLEVHRQLTPAEREYLVGCRLVSPDFRWRDPARSVLLDGSRATSVMVNEEDHVRVQALTAGWSVPHAEASTDATVEALSREVEFAWTSAHGFLAASPFNTGHGRRLSAMHHLIGLASSRRLGSVMKALSARQIAVRGLFGETSRAVGAFVQVSSTSASIAEYVGACEYLRTEEREARAQLGRDGLERRARQAVEFAVSSRSLSLADALRVLAWVRLASAAEITGFPPSYRLVDTWLTTIDIRSSSDEEALARQRADSLRAYLEM